MAFNLNEFRNKLVNGGARPNQFNMRITWPQQVPTGVAAAADYPFMCETGELPASNLGTIIVNYFGRKLKFAGDREFDTLSVNIINDEDFKIRAALEAWVAAISGNSTTVSQFNGGLTSDGYGTDAEMNQYSRNNNGNGGVPIKSYRFVGIFPIKVGAIPLDWNSENSIEKYPVEFAYQWWEPGTGSGISADVNI